MSHHRIGCKCCVTCYYLRPPVCCGGGPGPVRYRVRSNSALLEAFAASGDPLFVVLRPDGFVLGPGDGSGDYTTSSGGVVVELESTVEAECWFVELSTECDEGELINWVEFTAIPVGDGYGIGNISEATVLYDPVTFPPPEVCEENNLDNCPVVICGDRCVSASSIITTTLNASVYSSYLATDVVLDGNGTGTVGCAGNSSAGEGEDPPVFDSSPHPSPVVVEYWHWYVNCDGSGVLFLTLVSWETEFGVLRGQGNATFDADGNVTPILEVDITFPATVTATWSVSSPVAWTKVGDDCVLEEAP